MDTMDTIDTMDTMVWRLPDWVVPFVVRVEAFTRSRGVVHAQYVVRCLGARGLCGRHRRWLCEAVGWGRRIGSRWILEHGRHRELGWNERKRRGKRQRWSDRERRNERLRRIESHGRQRRIQLRRS